MRPETQVRSQRERPLPDVDAEEELELGRYWNALITRWWLPLLGFVAGIAIGYLLSFGGHQVYQAKATIYLGQPLSPQGTSQIQSLSNNPAAVKQVVLAPFYQHRAEQQAGLPAGSLRGRRTSSKASCSRSHERRRRPLAAAATRSSSAPSSASCSASWPRCSGSPPSGSPAEPLCNFRPCSTASGSRS